MEPCFSRRVWAADRVLMMITGWSKILAETISPSVTSTLGQGIELERLNVPYCLYHFENVSHSLLLGNSSALPKNGKPLGPGGRGNDDPFFLVKVRITKNKPTAARTTYPSKAVSPIAVYSCSRSSRGLAWVKAYGSTAL